MATWSVSSPLYQEAEGFWEEVDMKGYMGKVLFVNLTTGEIVAQDIPDKIYENLLSGVGLGAYFLFNEVDPSINPLSPENKLIFFKITGIDKNSFTAIKNFFCDFDIINPTQKFFLISCHTRSDYSGG